MNRYVERDSSRGTFCSLFPLRAQKLQSFHFFHPLLYARLPLHTRDNHINLLNFKDIISMSATSFPYPSFLGGLQLTYFCREGMRLIRDVLPYCAKGCVIGDEYKEAVGRTLVWKRNQFVTPTTRLQTFMIYHLWVSGRTGYSTVPSDFFPPICMDLFFYSGALSLILYIHSIFNMLGNQTLA